MSNELFTVIRNRDNTVDYVFNEFLMDELLKPFSTHGGTDDNDFSNNR